MYNKMISSLSTSTESQKYLTQSNINTSRTIVKDNIIVMEKAWDY